MHPKRKYSVESMSNARLDEIFREAAKLPGSPPPNEYRQDSRTPPQHPSTSHRKNSTKKSSLKRSGSRTGQYAHIGPKIDSKLDPKFIPGESHFQRPKHVRSSVSFRSDEQGHNDINEYDEARLDNNESVHQENDTHDESNLEYASPTSSSYSADIYAHFGEEAIRSASATSSPPYHSDSETLCRSTRSSRTSSRKATLEHATSNIEAYAKNTDSYKNKMNEKVEYNHSAPSSPGHKPSSRPTLPRRQTVKFEEPLRSPDRMSLHNHKRAQSLHVKPDFEANWNWRDALDGTCDDLLSLRNDFYKERRELKVAHELRFKDWFPIEVNGLRHKIEEVIGLYEKECRGLEHRVEGAVAGRRERNKQHEIRDRKNIERVKAHEKRIAELEGALKEEEVRKQENNEAYKRLEERTREVEQELQDNIERREQEQPPRVEKDEVRTQLEDSLTQKTKELEEASKTNQAQDAEIKRLEADLQASIPQSQIEEALGEAFRLHEQDVQRISDLEEALQTKQTKQVNNALATGTDAPEWHDVFQRMRKIRDAQEHEIMDLRTSLKKLDASHADLEREATAFREYVAVHRDAISSLQSQLAASTLQAKQWHSEYEQQRTMLDQRTVAEETALEALRTEMQLAITEYHSHMPTPEQPDALRITGLVHQLEARERALEEAMQRLEAMKREKGLLEKGIEEVVDEKKELVRRYEALRDGERPLPRVILDPETQNEIYVPEWNRDERVIRRGIAMEELLREQELTRRRTESEARLLEKARGWKMGKWYPPLSSEYEQLLKKSNWEMWEFKTWAEEEATNSEYEYVHRFGLLKERKKKGRRTKDWKGRRLSSMGLNNWDESN